MLVSWILTRIRRERQFRRSLRLLSSLSDHQLEDVGLDRVRLSAGALDQAVQR